jgi:hypothetical protein
MNLAAAGRRHATLKARVERTVHERDEMQRAINSALGALSLGCKARVTTKVARQILLNAPWFYNGENLNIVAKSVGAGVYELRLEDKGNARG